MIPPSNPRRAPKPAALHALILAGGFGRRLALLTRRLFGEAIPKQFCRFGSNRSLLQQTIERIAPMVAASDMTVVVDQSQLVRARQQLASHHDLFLVSQPCDRGTAAGVLLPLMRVLERTPDATLLVTASDHGVIDDAVFLEAVAAARRTVDQDPRRVVLIGAEPDGPNSDYGWIVRSELPVEGAIVEDVAHFIEKPSSDAAAALFAGGRALWNTMVLVARASALLDHFRARLPQLTEELTALLARDPGLREGAFSGYAALPQANFSADLLGATCGLGVVTLPAGAGWTDLGTEQRLVEWLGRKSVALPQAKLAAPTEQTMVEAS